MNLRGLKVLARQAATAHGHTMTRFQQVRDRSGMGYYYYDLHSSHCSQCGQSADVIQEPRPNEAQIAGEAVALHCKGSA